MSLHERINKKLFIREQSGSGFTGVSIYWFEYFVGSKKVELEQFEKHLNKNDLKNLYSAICCTEVMNCQNEISAAI